MNKYRRASLAGQWIWISREFLLENGPMHRSEYLEKVATLMPSHLRDSDGKLMSKMGLAKKSLQFGFARGYFVLDGALIRAVVRDRPRSDLVEKILRMANRASGITASDVDYQPRNTVTTYLSRLVRRGLLVRVSDGRYRAVRKDGENG